MCHSTFIRASIRIVALLALSVVNTQLSIKTRPNSNAITRKILWSDIRQFGVEGRGWNDTKSFYGRCLPAKAENLVRPPVWDLSPDSAGLLAELDPAACVLDCLLNMNANEIRERVEPFVKTLRAARPLTPHLARRRPHPQDSFLIAGRMEYYHLKDRALPERSNQF
jgi:hypothetical protein